MPYLTLVEKGSGKSHRVEATEALAGRDPACGIFLEGEEARTVSGHHARFLLTDGNWVVEDAGSRNGTYVGSQKLEPGVRHVLAVGDTIGFGLTGTQLLVRELAGRALAATVLEVPAGRAGGGTAPVRRSDAGRAGIHDMSAGEEVRIVLRGVQTGTRSVGQGNRVTIGRALECLIRVEGESATSVSRVHAEVNIRNGQVTVRDGGSRHGTFVNGKKIDGPTPIMQGDMIMLGPGGPTFAVDEASIAPAAPPGSPTPSSPPVREPSVGRTGGRNVPPKSPRSQQADAHRADDEAYRARHATPALDQPAFKKSTASQDVPADRKPTPPSFHSQTPPQAAMPPGATPRPARSSGAVWIGVGLLTVVAAAIVLIAKQKMDRTEGSSPGVRQQAGELEATRTAAFNDASLAKAALDSATRAGAPPTALDSLRRALDDANRRSADIEKSAKRAR